jgi:hypothetical protein
LIPQPTLCYEIQGSSCCKFHTDTFQKDMACYATRPTAKYSPLYIYNLLDYGPLKAVPQHTYGGAGGEDVQLLFIHDLVTR